MSQREKLIKRFLESPKDLEWNEFVTVLGHFGFRCEPGKGSRRRFHHAERDIALYFHEPHPRKTVLTCYIRQAIEAIEENGLLK